MSSNPSARDLVYDFAEILGQLNLPILDERLLPHPKETICGAFEEYIQNLKMRAQFDLDCQEELGRVQALYVLLFDFQAIDPEDMALVSEINAGRRFERFRTREGLTKALESPDDQKAMREFAEMRSKYLNRAIQDVAPPSQSRTPAQPPPPLPPTQAKPKPSPRKLTAKQIWAFRPVKATLIAAAINLVVYCPLVGYGPLALIVVLPMVAILALIVAAIFGGVMLIFKKPFLQSLGTGYSIAVIGVTCLVIFGEL